jgi:hypothetical protein
LREPQPPAPVGYLWAWFGRRRSVIGWWWALARLRPRGAVGVQAALGYLERIGGHRASLQLRAFVRLRASWLKSDPQLWATVGYAFLARDWQAAVVRWMSDWGGREGLQPWMLLNLTVALRDLGRDQEAAQVSQAALKLSWDHGIPGHRRWLALDAALEGPFEEASRLVANAPEGEAPIDALVLAMARAALAARSQEVPEHLRPGLVRGLLVEATETAGGLGRWKLPARLRRRISMLMPVRS